MKEFKTESEFEYKGYTCVVLAQRLGHRCGYIGFNKENLFYEKDYDDMCEIDVHGGLTYAGGGSNSKYPIESDLWWVGFDCAHGGDAKDLNIIRELNDENEHLNFLLSMSNYGTVKSLEYCIQECRNVVNQMIKINNKAKAKNSFSQVIKHIINGTTTIVTLENGNKGVARLHPDDEFNEY